jgi:hypothetical protein
MQADMNTLFKKIICVTIFSVALAPVPAQAQTLGRLFYSPQERRQLDAKRSGENIRPPVVAVLPRIKPNSALNVTPIITAAKPPKATVINGFVRRSDGPNTVWLNEKPISGNAAREEWLQPSAVNSPVRLQSSTR